MTFQQGRNNFKINADLLKNMVTAKKDLPESAKIDLIISLITLKYTLKNAQALAKGLVERGFNLVSGGTDNHLMLVDLRPFDITGKELEHRLDEVYITVNKNAIPNDPQKPFVTSGLRIGTPAVTTRGLKEAEMEKIAEYIYLAAKDFENKADFIREGVTEICTKYPLYE